MSEWKPINDNTPRDRHILLYSLKVGVQMGKYVDERFAKNPKPYWYYSGLRCNGIQYMRNHQPTHWMEVPDPPASAP